MKRLTNKGNGALRIVQHGHRLLEQIHQLLEELRSITPFSSDRLAVQPKESEESEESSFSALREELNRLLARMEEIDSQNRTLFEAIPVGLVIIEEETHRIVDANPLAVEMIGASREEIVGQYCQRFICPSEPGQCPISDRGEKLEASERTLLRLNGEIVPILKTVIRIERNGKPYLLESFVDLSESKRTEARLNYLAYHDPLTGLPNRLLFYDRLEQALARARRHKEPMAVMLLDLDRFQEINDTLGHETGDRLLQMTAKQLLKGIRESDTVAHLSGDEFFFILPDTDAPGAERTASRLLAFFSEP
ncbi:MAG: diguanylate cyclase domain-containing protein, partial [Bacteroidota bacterium]